MGPQNEGIRDLRRVCEPNGVVAREGGARVVCGGGDVKTKRTAREGNQSAAGGPSDSLGLFLCAPLVPPRCHENTRNEKN